MISVDEKLSYESLIIGMDSLLLAGFSGNNNFKLVELDRCQYMLLVKRHKGKVAGFKTGRKLVAQLSLTAMVDMFTVLVVFLLMNYKTTEDSVIYSKRSSFTRSKLRLKN